MRKKRPYAITGWDIEFATPTASLDRIDSFGIYVPINLQWVHKEINRMKGQLSEIQLIEICKAIIENRSVA